MEILASTDRCGVLKELLPQIHSNSQLDVENNGRRGRRRKGVRHEEGGRRGHEGGSFHASLRRGIMIPLFPGSRSEIGITKTKG